MNGESKIKKFFAKIKAKKNWEIAVAVVAVIAMLLLYFSAKSKSGKKASAQAVPTAQDYCERMSEQLCKTLSSMRGVGKVRVSICWESGVEKVIAYATNTSGGNVSTTPTIVQVQGNGTPIVLKELYPKPVGVLIICQGGNNVAVKLDVMNAASTLLDISQNKVNVYAMK